MSLASAGVADNARQVLTPSEVDGGLVAFAGPALGFLAGPARLPLEDLADVLGMEVNAEMTPDERGDAVGGPKFGAPTVGLGALEQESLQALLLLSVEPWPWRPTGRRPGGQLLWGFPVPLQPGVNRGAATAEEAGQHRRGIRPA